MLPAIRGPQQALVRRLPRTPASLLALALGGLAAPALAQDGAAPVMGTVENPQGAPPDLSTPLPPLDQSQAPPPSSSERRINFEADQLDYAQDADTVTATGNVVLRNDQKSVRADKVVWNRKTGQIVGSGNVRFVDEDGNQLYTSRIELTDKFEAGAMEDLLLALREGGRLAAASGQRQANGSIELTRAAYTGCDVVDSDGCPKKPSWRITADNVVYTPSDKKVRFRGAYLELFGARVLPLPGLAVRTDGRPVSGFLIPDLQYTRNNGLQVSGSYYFNLGPNRDLTVTGYAFTAAPPMVSGQWRHLTDLGAYQVTAYLTDSRQFDLASGTSSGSYQLRGYLFANGRFQFDPNWSVDFSLRRASDRTFLRRYDISRDDRLRSMFALERIDADSYLGIKGYATQTMILSANQGQVPLALPLIDYRRRIDTPWLLGGKVELTANTLALSRSDGQDTQRAFVGAQWDLKRVTSLGQVLTLTALVRGDAYHSDENGLTATAIYRGNPGWEFRGVGLVAADLEWPFVGPAFGGTQVLTPRVQIVATPPIRNLAIPNEDARAVDLEDSNLFALNRFPGYDRIEDGPRATYGVDWQLTFPNWRISSTLGQSYRLTNRASILPNGTGLSERLSDYVGRTEIRYKDFVKLTHRFRLDKDNFAVRRNEIDATVGSRKTYLELGYLRLNRNITTVEDLQDREELRAAARVAFANYWSVFGSGVFNLTDKQEDPTLTSNGFQPLRTRLGVAYQDDCLELGVTWRRDYVDQGDARRGNTFQLYFALRNLGFR